MNILVTLGAFVGVMVAVMASFVFRDIAEMKGHHERKYFWWCLLCGFAGWTMVIALPDRGNREENMSATCDDLPDL